MDGASSLFLIYLFLARRMREESYILIKSEQRNPELLESISGSWEK